MIGKSGNPKSMASGPTEETMPETTGASFNPIERGAGFARHSLTAPVIADT
jgi:hypothetical protein